MTHTETKPDLSKIPASNCCQAPTTVQGDETKFYTCLKCGKACDLWVSPTPPTVSVEVTAEQIVDDFIKSDNQALFRDQCVRDIKSLFALAKQQERASIISQLKYDQSIADDEAKRGWTKHCTCLGYAIDRIEHPENYDDLGKKLED